MYNNQSCNRLFEQMGSVKKVLKMKEPDYYFSTTHIHKYEE